ncbi:MAG: calcineurin-like phosphoesterase family protein [Phycisphaerales bacterium]|nr:calcineurin-like phosphoesterase family protein [Phycisphaerales bacterium]
MKQRFRMQQGLMVAVIAGTWLATIDRDLRAGDLARGVVFEDRNRDGMRGPDEKGLFGVGVSNGRDVVLTDSDGQYELAVDDDDIVFVLKPRNYMTAVDSLHLPRFYYVHKPKGSPKHLKYRGVKPTGALPKSVNFPLVCHPEPDKFDVIISGDPQPRNPAELDHFAHDVVPEWFGIEAAFGVTLGDIVFDDLNLLEPYNAIMSTVGIPWHNVHGNHDMNYDVKSDELADETWERIYGPPTYSFDWGPVHFIVLDNVMYDGDTEQGKYHSEIGRHLAFIENDLKHVPREKLVVLMMHVPIVSTIDKEKLFALLKERPHTFSLSAHWHFQQHFFLDQRFGWEAEKPHHHLVHATACGSWWQGAPDEFGIPHAMMRCGAPNGYSIVTFNKQDYSIRFKAARRPAEDQMAIFAPSRIDRAQTHGMEVVVNVFAGSERSVVEMRIDDAQSWIPMKQVKRHDPYLTNIINSERSRQPPNGRKMGNPIDSPHLWAAKLPAKLPRGAHTIEIRTRDIFGQIAHGHRVIRVE